MYLHGFVAPQIVEYDTLTSEERWNEYADVILANPPFMSPKGGIRPHNRFSIQSKRSEVLFVDYMAEHLNAGGRAGIIVPEGIIFQSQNAHKQLRKKLVEDCLVAVVSLPPGVFNPYSGVKTSILLLDKALARKTDRIAFFKVENDGYNLGAQRRPIEQNDLPQVGGEIAAYMQRLRAGDSSGNVQTAPTALAAERRTEYTTAESQPGNGLIVAKERVAADGEYNLTRGRYIQSLSSSSAYPMVALGEVADLIRGITFRKSDQLDEASADSLFVATTKAAQELGIVEEALYHIPRSLLKDPAKLLQPGDILISTANSLRLLGRTTHVQDVNYPISFGAFMSVIRRNSRIDDTYLLHCLRTENAHDFFLRHANTTTNISNLNHKALAAFQIPLPPLEVQQEIVAEIEDYQKIIDGARAVVENYRPHIHVDPDWPIVTFSEAPFEIIDGDRGVNYPKKEDFSSDGYCVFLNTKNVRPNGFDFEDVAFISRKKDEALRKGRLCRKDVVITTRGTVGNTGYYDNSVPFDRIRINSGMLIFRVDESRLSGVYLFRFFQSQNFRRQRESIVSGSAQPQLPIRSLNQAILPVPTLETQQAIVAEIDAEQALVDANRELIERFESKIKDVIARTWAKDKPNTKTLRKAND